MVTSLVLPTSQLGRPAAQSAHSTAEGPFLRLHHSSSAVFGQDPKLKLIASTEKAVGGGGISLFHEAGVWVGDASGKGDVYITSNMLETKDDALHIKICRLRLGEEFDAGAEATLRPSANDAGVFVSEEVEYEDLDQLAQLVPMANGATASVDGKDILWCSQGQALRLPLSKEPVAGSLMLCREVNGHFLATPLVNNFRGREFNALNDVCCHAPTGAIFFTDPDYGLAQGFKGPSQLPNGVWRLMPETGVLSLVADDLKKPNGIVCSPDGKTCYITDTDFIYGDGSMDPTRAGTIYAFDIVGTEAPQLHNKRVFALVDCGAPDGIKVDTEGNVYTGTFEGVDIYAPSGILLGKILLRDSSGQQGGCANLVFGPAGVLFLLSETSVWAAKIEAIGALKGVRMGSSPRRAGL
ncbi:hypothetical protein BCR35DRAFT_292964 [Leucosporidium creatinivorum]|uniref:SMP-30/Gluconolactonase/LRE-like region domain-containing protein n=1 Tax=Leucosporidium creatinivorum TaxID=106004 RepID=A0A1Y2EUS2_9BASI|nr:hypothetical protein BCR35DRAFT_292964 [Leucosporidium creatinivorum]